MTASWLMMIDQNLSPSLRKALGKAQFFSKGVYFFSKESKMKTRDDLEEDTGWPVGCKLAAVSSGLE